MERVPFTKHSLCLAYIRIWLIAVWYVRAEFRSPKGIPSMRIALHAWQKRCACACSCREIWQYPLSMPSKLMYCTLTTLYIRSVGSLIGKASGSVISLSLRSHVHGLYTTSKVCSFSLKFIKSQFTNSSIHQSTLMNQEAGWRSQCLKLLFLKLEPMTTVPIYDQPSLTVLPPSGYGPDWCCIVQSLTDHAFC